MALVVPIFGVESFAGINLDVDTVDDVATKLINREYDKVDVLGTSCFNKSISNVNAYVVIPRNDYDDSNIVSLISVIFMPSSSTVYTNYDSLKIDYNTIKELMVNKYGKPKSAVKFSRPYEDGDGYELLALKTDKLLVADIWENVNGMTITMTMNKSCFFRLIYASNKSVEKGRKEAAETAKDL